MTPKTGSSIKRQKRPEDKGVKIIGVKSSVSARRRPGTLLLFQNR